MTNKTLEIIKNNIIEKSKNIPDEHFLIKWIWNFDMKAQPNINERIFTESGLIVATSGLWTSFYMPQEEVIINDSLIWKDGRYIKTDNVALQVAILDSCYAIIPSKPNKEYVLNGDTTSKSIERAKIIVEEIKLILKWLNTDNPSILMIGVVKAIIKELSDNNINPILSDLDNNIINAQVKNFKVIDWNSNIDLIKKVDIILMTGMTISTSTIDEILLNAKKQNKPVVIYAQTGSNFAQEYIRLWVKTVISEAYPWYCFPWSNKINIYRW